MAFLKVMATAAPRRQPMRSRAARAASFHFWRAAAGRHDQRGRRRRCRTRSRRIRGSRARPPPPGRRRPASRPRRGRRAHLEVGIIGGRAHRRRGDPRVLVALRRPSSRPAASSSPASPLCGCAPRASPPANRSCFRRQPEARRRAPRRRPPRRTASRARADLLGRAVPASSACTSSRGAELLARRNTVSASSSAEPKLPRTQDSSAVRYTLVSLRSR